MISSYTKFDKDGIKVEVNWNEKVKPCEKIKFSIGNETAIMDRADFYAMMMLFGDEDHQTDLIPVVETKVKKITRLLKVKAKKDIKQGETIAFPYSYFVPLGVYEKLRLSRDVSGGEVL